MALGSGQQTQYVYYTATQQGGRLYQIKTGPTGSPSSTLYLQYGYDRVGNVTLITDHNNSGQLQLFAYDALNRLTTAAAIGGLDGYYTRTYQYDAIGNMTLGDGGYYYYESVRPHAVITVGNPLSGMTAYYGYDGNGSATFITRTLLSMTYTLTYDPENRVKQVAPSDGPTATFRYDGDGTRVLGIVGGVTTTYAGTWYEYTTSGVSYYYFNGQRVAMRSADGVTYMHRDHLGSGVATTGAVTEGQMYDAWGETRGTSTVDTPYRYTGQREEDDLLLYFYNARWYDAGLGRFIQADSIVPEPGNPQSLNRYSYVLNNPLGYADPTGHAYDSGGPSGKPKARQPSPRPPPTPRPAPTETRVPFGYPQSGTAMPTGLPQPIAIVLPRPGGGSIQIGTWTQPAEGQSHTRAPVIDAIGWRFDVTLQAPMVGGVDANADLMVNLRSREADLLLGWGLAGGPNASFGWTTGPVFVWNCPSNGSLAGVDLTYGGFDAPVAVLAVNLEGEMAVGVEGDGPMSVYMGVSPIGPGGLGAGLQTDVSVNAARVPLARLP